MKLSKEERRRLRKEKKSGFFAEFKKFITRGNVVDMSVGVIVGGAFTAIVNALSNNILKPIINYLLTLIFKVISSTKGIIWEGICRNYSLLSSWSMEYIAPGRLINLCYKKN